MVLKLLPIFLLYFFVVVIRCQPQSCPKRKCMIYCNYGYRTDQDGCKTCKCRTGIVFKENSEDLQAARLLDYRPRNCVTLTCPFGYRKSCFYFNTEQVYKPTARCKKCYCKKCTKKWCRKGCKYGYKRDKNGCKTCKCNPIPL